MLNSKAYQIFSTLDKAERREMLEFLQSPYFNKDEMPVSLFRYFCGDKGVDKRGWFASQFPEREYDDLKVRRHLSALNGLLERYLVLKQMEQWEGLQRELALSALRQRVLPKHYKAHLAKPPRRDKAPIGLTSRVFLHEYQVACEQEKFNTQLNQRQPKGDIDENILNLDLFYIIEKLRNICELSNSRTIFEIEGRSYLNDEVLEIAKKPPFSDYPQVRAYTLLLDTTRESNDDSAFQALWRLMDGYGGLFSTYEERQIYLALVNYCIRGINRGDTNSLQRCFDLYKKMARKNLLVSGKYLSPWTYKNIVTAALRLNELDWTKRFIKDYQKQLDPQHRDNAFHYNLAKYHFHSKRYGKVLELLQKVGYDDVFYGLDTRVLLMKVYYLQGEQEALFSLTDSFRIHLRRRKKIPRERRETYLNFIKFVRRLVSLHPRDRRKLEALRQKILATEKVADKQWISEEIKAILEKI